MDKIKGRTNKALTNIAFNVGNQVLSLVLAFVSRTVFINVLGVTYLGISGLFADILNMLSLADLGFNTAMVYSLYQPLKDSDYNKIAALISFYRKIYICVAGTVLVLGLACIPFLPYIVNTETEIPHLTLYYLISLANVVASYLCVYKTSVLYADQKQYVITSVTMVVSILRTVCQILAVYFLKSYVAYLILGCAGAVLTNVIASVIAVKKYPFLKQKIALGSAEKKDIFNNIGSVFIYKLSTVLITATDNILISVLISTIAVGYYSNYLLLQNKISMFYVIIFSSVTASIGNLIVSEKKEKGFEIFQCEQSVSAIICCVVVPCFTVLVNDFIRIWLGDDYTFAGATVLAIGLNMFLTCVLQPLWSFREATGLYRKTKWAMMICAVLNIALSVILGKLIGITGVLLATSISKLSTYILYEPKLLFNEYFGKPAKLYYFDLIKSFAVISVLVAANYFIFRSFEITSWALWIVKALAVGAISLLCSYCVYFKSPGYKMIKNKFLSLLKRADANNKG